MIRINATPDRLFPFLAWGRTLTRETIRADLVAGLIGTIVVLPQAVAFAMIAGMPPHYGLYAAIVPTIIAALWGSSHHLVSGPTTAISLVVFASLTPLATPGTEHYIALAITLSFLIGLMQLTLGIAKLGVLVRLISPSVVVGFTAGAGVLIAASQLKHALGVPVPTGSSFIETIGHLFTRINSIEGSTAILSCATVLCGVLAKRYVPKVPYLIVAMLGGMATYLIMVDMPGVAVAPTIGMFTATLPPLSLPTIDFETLRLLAPATIAIALLGLTEALAIARSVALRSGQHIDGNLEFMGQGLSNIAGSFFSAYPSSGSFNRTGANFDAGARTPLAAVVSAVALLACIPFISTLVAHVPLAVMAGALLVVAWGIIDTRHIRHIAHTDKTELVVLLCTFTTTLIFDLELAIFTGVLLSVALFIRHVMRAEVIEVAEDSETHSFRSTHLHPSARPYPHTLILRIDMSIVYLNTDSVHAAIRRHIERYSETHDDTLHRIVLNLSGVNRVDSAGVAMLEAIHAYSKERDISLAFANTKYMVRDMLARHESLNALPILYNTDALRSWASRNHAQ